MGNKKRFFNLLLLSTFAFKLFKFYNHKTTKIQPKSKNYEQVQELPEQKTFEKVENLFTDFPSYLDLENDFQVKPTENSAPDKCTVNNPDCFDSSKCQDFKIFIYKEGLYSIDENLPWRKLSLYERILLLITESDFYTTDPEKACIFIPPYDTLVRDRLDIDYVKNVNTRLWKLPYWNGGKNHVIFNLYAGTWPDYLEDLRLDAGKSLKKLFYSSKSKTSLAIWISLNF